MPANPPAPTVSRLRRLRVAVGTIITVGVLGQAALLIGLGYWGAQRIVGTLAASVHRADHQRVEDRIRAFLDKGVAVARTMAAAPQLEPAGPASAPASTKPIHCTRRTSMPMASARSGASQVCSEGFVGEQ
mgnify:CR=1 FL=1